MGLSTSPSGVALPVSVANGGTGQTTLASLPLVTPVLGVEDTLTAHAGGTQGAALVLSSACNYHRISTCATAADSVVLPAATVGNSHFIRNDGAAACQVFGVSPDTINGVATGTGISLAVGTGSWFICTTAAKWTMPQASTPALQRTAIAAYGNGDSPSFVNVALTGTMFTNSGAVRMLGGSFGLASGGQLTFGSDASDANTGKDSGIKRGAAGVITGTNGSSGVGYFQTTGVTVSALPSAATVGAGTMGFVTDASTTFILGLGVAVTGGGANKVPVYSDGSSWLVG